MPNKTIYVSDDDLPLFERAQELAGANLSSSIVRALRRFIELEEAKQNGFDEITVIVNTEGAHRRKRFVGQRLVRWVQPMAQGKGTEVISVYRTARQRYALHTRAIRDWDLSWGDPEHLSAPKNSGLGTGLVDKVIEWARSFEHIGISSDYSLQVFETLEDLKAHVSQDLFTAVTQSMEGPDIEDLDI
jgi:EXLDI family protein